ncbi:hypothetical protein BGZ58_007582 [Dissophora ornata]|nr:hypothetical protein BGZ58_007582 [Dissophora ornata]
MIHVEPLYYTLACALSFENSVFFLLQGFWNYISKSVTKSSFMSSLEFKINMVASCFAIVLFPTVQFVFRKDFVYREAAPQMLFSILTFITGAMCIRTHFRLKSLINNAREVSNETTAHVLQKLEYFKDMNMVLCFSLFGVSIPLGIMSADGLTPNPIVATDKFASDFLITNMNFFEFIIWVTLTLIFYPRKTGVGSPFSSGSSDMPSLATAKRHTQRSEPRDAHLPRFNDVKPQEIDLYGKPDYMHELDHNPAWSNEDLEMTHHNYYTLSTENLQATPASVMQPVSEPLPPPATAAPAASAPAAATTSAPISSPDTAPSSTKPKGKPKMHSNTVYYHEGLVKAKTQQRQQDQEFYTRSLESDALANPNNSSSSLPGRSAFPTGQQPLWNDSGSQRALIQKPKNPMRGKTGSLDFRAPREYPSLAQETADIHRTGSSGGSRQVTPIHTASPLGQRERGFSLGSGRQNQSYETALRTASPLGQIDRSVSSGTSRQQQPQSQLPPPKTNHSYLHHSLQQPRKLQQQQQPMYNEMANGARAATALAAPPRSNSGESDRSMIQIAYIRSLGQGEGHGTTNFYEELGREHLNTATTAANDASRPYSPRHF